MAPVSRTSSPANGRVTHPGARQRQQSSESSLSAMMPERLTSCVDDYPLTSLCAAFGGGLIIGVGLVALYCQTQSQNPSFNSMANSMSDSADTLMHRVSDSVRSTLSQYMPHFHS